MPSDERIVAVIVDVARSRSHPDRRELQQRVETSFARANSLVKATQPLASTVGDEFQAAYPDTGRALRAILLARLCLPEGIDCRFGLGFGTASVIRTGSEVTLQDGPAWWSARAAIDTARNHQYSRLKFVRSWFHSHADPPELASPVPDDFVNSYLLTQDFLMDSMQGRARRLLLGRLLGRTQQDLAREEKISQSAVSQTLQRSGAIAVLESVRLLDSSPLNSFAST